MLRIAQSRPYGRKAATVTRFLGFVLLSVIATACPGGVGFAADHTAPPERYAAQSRAGLTTIGYVERVAIDPGNIHVTAEIDTGALSASLDAANIEKFRKDGKDWVRFTFRGDNDASQQMELPIARKIHIRQANGPVEQRYVVKMGICLGSYHMLTEVNLARRKGLHYRMLIGRRFMEGNFVVDPSSRFLTHPSCPSP